VRTEAVAGRAVGSLPTRSRARPPNARNSHTHPNPRCRYPFYPAELYHQFHDDFMGPSYGKAYNSLQGRQYKQGLVGLTGCPDMDPVRDEGRYAKGFPS
jgi:hypothetical protein